MDKISIILPVFNVEHYLKKCIDSILNQTYKNIEIIIIDDGSTDGSASICDYYTKTYDFIKCVHKENGGLSSARNAGLEMCSGEYISFVDSDDYIHPEMLDIMLRNLKQYKADISVCGYTMVYPSKSEEIKEGNDIKVYDPELAFKVLFHRNNIGVLACNKLFASYLFRDIRFPENQQFEDINTIYKVISISKRIVYEPTALYFYNQRTDSINGNNFKSKNYDSHIEDMVNAASEVYEFVAKNFSVAISDIAIGTIDYYLRALNQKILFNIPDYELKARTKNLIKEYFMEIISYKYITVKKKIQFILFFFSFSTYQKIVKIIKQGI